MKAKYWSLFVGPRLRVNEFVSLCAGTARADAKERIRIVDYREGFSGSENRTGWYCWLYLHDGTLVCGLVYE